MYESRKKLIHDFLLQEGVVTVSELIQILSVSDMTNRRDIRSLASEGLLKQVHGGAVCVDRICEERSFSARHIEQQAQKRAIALLAPSLLQDGQSLFLDGSTTCSELAQPLKGARRFTVVTDSLSVLNQLSSSHDIELLVLGGVLKRDGNTFDGPLAIEGTSRIRVDCCFFSAAGFSENGVRKPWHDWHAGKAAYDQERE
jgi:DeoR/GlpR family transcriptional regulator of sugar metabolism